MRFARQLTQLALRNRASVVAGERRRQLHDVFEGSAQLARDTGDQLPGSGQLLAPEKLLPYILLFLQLKGGAHLVCQMLGGGLFFEREITGPSRVSELQDSHHFALCEQGREHSRARQAHLRTGLHQRAPADVGDIQQSPVSEAHHGPACQPVLWRVDRDRHRFRVDGRWHVLQRLGAAVEKIQARSGGLCHGRKHGRELVRDFGWGGR